MFGNGELILGGGASMSWKLCQSYAWWLTSGTPALTGPMQEVCHVFQANLDYIVSSRPAWATAWDPISKSNCVTFLVSMVERPTKESGISVHASEGMVPKCWEGLGRPGCGEAGHTVPAVMKQREMSASGQLQDPSLRDNASTFDYKFWKSHLQTALTVNIWSLGRSSPLHFWRT